MKIRFLNNDGTLRETTLNDDKYLDALTKLIHEALEAERFFTPEELEAATQCLQNK